MENQTVYYNSSGFIVDNQTTNECPLFYWDEAVACWYRCERTGFPIRLVGAEVPTVLLNLPHPAKPPIADGPPSLTAFPGGATKTIADYAEESRLRLENIYDRLGVLDVALEQLAANVQEILVELKRIVTPVSPYNNASS